MWRHIWNVIKRTFGFGIERESSIPDEPYRVTGYRGYTIAITKDFSDPRQVTYTVVADNAEAARVMADGGPHEVSQIKSCRWYSRDSAARGICVQIDAALDD